jgi:hypothetical protein
MLRVCLKSLLRQIINGNGPLSKPTPAVRPWPRERVFLPHSRRLRGNRRREGDHSRERQNSSIHGAWQAAAAAAGSQAVGVASQIASATIML